MGKVIDKSDLFNEIKDENTKKEDLTQTYKRVAISLDNLEKTISDTESIIETVDSVLARYGE